MAWKDLSMSDKSQWMRFFIKNGITDAKQMSEHYNSFAEGGNIDDPPQPRFVQRLVQGNNRAYIRDWEDPRSIATHKLSYAEDKGRYYVYPDVQEINGELHDFTDPKYNHGKWDSFDNAMRNGNVLEFPTEEAADNFTRTYKNSYVYPWAGTMQPSIQQMTYQLPGRSFAEGGDAKYPPFNPNVAVTHDISDLEKQKRGLWHLNNASNVQNSVLTQAYNDALQHNLDKMQALEYVRDVAYSKGWSEQGGNDVGRPYANKTTRVNTINKGRKYIQDYIQKLERNSERAANAASAIGTAATVIPHPAAQILGSALQLPALYKDVEHLITEPNVPNAIDMGVDFVQPIPQLPGWWDDALRTVGTLWDGYSAVTGNSPAEKITEKTK